MYKNLFIARKEKCITQESAGKLVMKCIEKGLLLKSVTTRSLKNEIELVNEFFVVSSINMEEVTSVLEEKEKSIILHISEKYTAEELALKFWMARFTIHQKKRSISNNKSRL
ncbi:hypothetical protein P4283_29125 [Bacillus thuringiensis]|nr:hypothetical protein [Bacillus thuringiensis]